MRIGIDAGRTHTDAVTLQGRTVVASVPDRITMVDHETSSPINSGRVHYGRRVTAFGVGCPPHYRTARALKLFQPRAFGFDIDFVPLEELQGPGADSTDSGARGPCSIEVESTSKPDKAEARRVRPVIAAPGFPADRPAGPIINYLCTWTGAFGALRIDNRRPWYPPVADTQQAAAPPVPAAIDNSLQTVYH